MTLCSLEGCERKAGNEHWSGLCGLHFVWLLHRKRTKSYCTCGVCKKGEREYRASFGSVPKDFDIDSYRQIQSGQGKLV
jgi:hypothetical protein